MSEVAFGTIGQPAVRPQLGHLPPSYSPAGSKPLTHHQPSTLLVVPGSGNYQTLTNTVPRPNVHLPPPSPLTPQHRLPTGSTGNPAATVTLQDHHSFGGLSGSRADIRPLSSFNTPNQAQPSLLPQFYPFLPTGFQGQQQQPLSSHLPTDATTATPSTKKVYSIRYWGQQFRPVVKVTPQQAVIPGTLPFTYAVQTPTGVKYATYRRPAALAVHYNATKVHYQPVESHGYQITF